MVSRMDREHCSKHVCKHMKRVECANGSLRAVPGCLCSEALLTLLLASQTRLLRIRLQIRGLRTTASSACKLKVGITCLRSRPLVAGMPVYRCPLRDNAD